VTLPDLQNDADLRGIPINEVGISGIRYPVSIHDAEHGKQETVANVSLSVALPAERRGSHLSRFVEVLEAYGTEFTPQGVEGVLDVLRQRLQSTSARLTLDFPYFLRRQAPVSGASALVGYDCTLAATLAPEGFGVQLKVRVPVTSVCPCSKAISDYGAHNQRGYLTIQVIPTWEEGAALTVWFDQLIEVGETSGSSPIYPILKREDERYVTMAAYDRPVFVEDMVRSVADHLRDDPRIRRFCVEALNDESIHDHRAYARLAWPPDESTVSW
jgi:GTP cyclohydrolase I